MMQPDWRASDWLGIITAGALWTAMLPSGDFEAGIQSIIVQINKSVHGARFLAESCTRSCHLFPRLLAGSEQACDQCHSSRVSTFLTSSHCKFLPKH
jgi:hypothetical protein